MIEVMIVSCGLVRLKPGCRLSLKMLTEKIWIATSENGLYSYDQRTTQVRTYQYDANDTTSLLRNTLTTMAIDRKKRLWDRNLWIWNLPV